MELRKTKFGNIVWIIYGILTLLFSALIFTRLADYFHIDQGIGLLFSIVFTLAFTGIFFAALSAKKQIAGRKSNKKTNNKGVKAFSYFMFAFLIILGMFCRLFIYSVNPSGELFGSFKFEMILQVLTGACAFYLVNRISGYLAGLLCEAIIMFSPTFSGINPNCEFTDYLTLLVFVAALSILSDLIFLDKKEIVPAIFGGLVLGGLLSYDFSAMAIIPVLILYFAFKPHYLRKKISLLLYIVFLFAGFAAGVFIISLIGSESFVKLLRETVYTRFSFRTGSTINFSNYADLVTGSIIALMMMPGILAGFFKRTGRKEIVLVITAFSLMIMCLAGFDMHEGAAGLEMVILFAALAGVSFRNTFVPEKISEVKEKKEDSIINEITEEELDKEIEEEPKAEEPKEEESKEEEPKEEEPKEEEPKAEEPKAEEPKAEEPKAEIKPGQPLDNPLPGPKKHKEGGQIEYDYYVSENADYDI